MWVRIPQGVSTIKKENAIMNYYQTMLSTDIHWVTIPLIAMVVIGYTLSKTSIGKVWYTKFKQWLLR